MAFYANDIAALPPLASAIDDNPADAIAQGDALNEDHITAARLQHTTRKHLSAASVNAASAAEVTTAKRRKHLVESSNFEEGAVPVWAAQLQQQMQAMQNQMQNQMQAMQNQMQAMQNQTDRRIDQESQRSMNRSLRDNQDPVEPLIRLADGEFPNNAAYALWFPANNGALYGATGLQMDPLLAFYGLPTDGSVEVRRRRLRRFLGITL
jgi:hypothetical protein